MAFLEAQVGKHPPEVAGEVQKILYRNRCAVRLGVHNAPDGAMLESADARGVGLAAVTGDVVESTNYILKKRYNGHSSRGGGAGKSAVEREAMVVQQVWEWWFLPFDLPLLHYNTPHTAACTAASVLSTTPQAPSTHAPSATQLYCSSPIHGRLRAEETLEESPKATLALVVCCLCVVVRVHIAFIIRRS